MPNPAGPVLVIAHRGARRVPPENTIEAFDAALRQGVDGIEFDVQCAADGTPVVWHDATLARAGQPRRAVSALPARTLAGLGWGGPPASARTAIPRLRSILSRYGPRTHLMVELKNHTPPGMRPRWLDRVAVQMQSIDPRRCHVLSFESDLLAGLRQRCAHLSFMLNVKAWDRSQAERFRSQRDVRAVCLDARQLSADVARHLNACRLAFAVYACEQRRLAQRALAMGAFAVIGDRPDALRRWVGGAGG